MSFSKINDVSFKDNTPKSEFLVFTWCHKIKKTKVYLPQSRFQHGMWIYRKFQVLKMFYFDLWRFQMCRTIYHVI